MPELPLGLCDDPRLTSILLHSPSLDMKFISKQGSLAARLDLRFLIREVETFAPNQKRLQMRTFLRLAWRSEIIFLTREAFSCVFRFIVLPTSEHYCSGFLIVTAYITCECIKYISLNIHIYITKHSSAPLYIFPRGIF